MSSGSSKLNPYAAEYVPLAKREEDESKLAPGHSVSSKAVADSNSHNTAEFHPEEGHYGSSSQENGQFGGVQADDGQLEMDLAYLQTQFPTISEQSVADVYFFNDGDVDAAYDMITHLEHSDSVPQLPDSLEIGDVSDPAIVPEFSKMKLKEVEGVTSSASVNSPEHAQPQN